jgi:hypothetical protein
MHGTRKAAGKHYVGNEQTAAFARSGITPAAYSRMARSKVTNGKHVFVEGNNKRSPWTRRFKDILAQIIADLGGADLLSEGQRQIARRAATISIMCEKLEIDLEQYGQLTDRLGRCFNRLGLKRQARDVTGLTLADLIQQDQRSERERREAESALSNRPPRPRQVQSEPAEPMAVPPSEPESVS